MDTPAIERVTRELALRKALQDALLLFGRGVSARSSLAGALEALCVEANGLLGTARMSVWLHDRNGRTLTLSASSDPRDTVLPQAISTEEDSPVASVMRDLDPRLSGQGAAQWLGAPLRGWRRALGTLVLEGSAREAPAERLVDIIRDFAAHLSVALENVLVLDEVIRQHARQSEQALHGPSEKLAALGQVIAGIAHELNNPLQGVLGHVELLLASMPGGPAREDLQRIFTDADRAAKVVRNLLVFTGSRRLAKRQIDVLELIDSTIALREDAPAGGEVEVVRMPAAGPLSVLGDDELLQQALLNVLVNAEQALAERPSPRRIVVTPSSSAGIVRIVLEDTGPGIDPHVMARIFEPFFTTKALGKGTGLGLAIAAGIVHSHGGTIRADRSPLGGARFTIELPAADGKVKAPGAS